MHTKDPITSFCIKSIIKVVCFLASTSAGGRVSSYPLKMCYRIEEINMNIPKLRLYLVLILLLTPVYFFIYSFYQHS